MWVLGQLYDRHTPNIHRNGPPYLNLGPVLQEKLSQGVNHQDKGGTPCNRGLPYGLGLLIHCSYC
jgi:hypothetical protein